MSENKKKNESVSKTLLVVALLCLICSVVVAGSAVGFRAVQQEQRRLDVQRNLMDVAGLFKPGMTTSQINQVFSDHIEPRLLDLPSGQLLDSAAAAKFDLSAALRSDEHSIKLTSEQDKASIRRRSNQLPIYLVRNDQQAIEMIILPIYGSGVWSMMYAFLAVEVDGNTIRALNYYRQGETPGLGGEVQNPNWSRQFTGKQLFNEQGKPALRVVTGGARPGDIHGVDGLTGATLTAVGVQNTFNFWLGDKGFGPFLQKVREGALKQDVLKQEVLKQEALKNG